MKRLAKSLINTKQAPLSKPLQNFVMEMSLGMAVTGTCCVTEIGRKLGEESKRQTNPVLAPFKKLCSG